MGTRLLTLIAPSCALPALLCLLSVTVGCGPASIEEQCGDIARRQCDACFSCAEALDEIDGAALCKLSAGVELEGCIERFQDRCQGQASTLEDSSDDLQACVDSLPEPTCEPLYGAWAQDKDFATDACAFFL